MTRQAFIDYWKHRVAGMALYGSICEQTEGPMNRVNRAYQIPGEVERLLGSQYDSLFPQMSKPAGAETPAKK